MLDKFGVAIAVLVFACIGFLGVEVYRMDARLVALEESVIHANAVAVSRDEEIRRQQEHDDNLQSQINDLSAAVLYQTDMLRQMFSAIDFRFRALEEPVFP